MTVIAWDGKTLAADKAASCAGFKNTVTKIHRVPGGLVALAGDGDSALDLLAWFRGGRMASDYPACQKGHADERASAIFIDQDRRIWTYDKSANAQHNEQPFIALGSGRDYALSVMFLGLGARLGVEVACALDAYCGNGIDTLELDE